MPEKSKYQTNFLETNNRRMLDAREIAEQGQVVASISAAILLISGQKPDLCIASRQKILDRFNASTRDSRMKTITYIQSFCIEHAEEFNPHFNDNPLALNTRRLDLISRIVRAEIAEGIMAVDVADFLLGRRSFELQGNDIYLNWRVEQDVLDGKI